jgi:glycosyltransferase involved in cell wall biosynthesis
MTRPLVSIIIPCYNGEHFVGEAIQSALAQSYQDKEVIVVDDGSRDRSIDVIRSFGDSIRCCFMDENRGGSVARNEGLRLARGEFIQFLDADDLLEPQKVERQLEVLLRTGVDAVYSDWRLCELQRPEVGRTCRVDAATDDPVVLALDPQSIQTDAALHRRVKLDAVGGFRPGLPCCQERDMMLRLASHGARFSRLPGVYHTVRLHPGGVSSDRLRIVYQMRSVLEESYEYLRANGELTDARKRAFARLISRQGRNLLQRGKRELANEYFTVAAGMHAQGWLEAYTPTTSMLVRVLGPAVTDALLRPAKALFNWRLNEINRTDPLRDAMEEGRARVAPEFGNRLRRAIHTSASRVAFSEKPPLK